MIRCKHAVAARLVGNVLYDEHSGCAAHVLHNIIFKATGEQDIVGNCHAVQFVLSIAGRRNELLAGLKEIIKNELVIHEGPPPERYAEYARKVVDSSLLRKEKQVRARLGKTDPGHRGATLREMSEPLCKYCNGDLSKEIHKLMLNDPLALSRARRSGPVEKLAPAWRPLVVVSVAARH